MAQQQLILLVLGIVVTLIAVLAGFTAFTEKQRQWDDETRQQAMLALAAEAQAWKVRPAFTGGGDNAQAGDFSFLRLSHLGLTADTTLADLQVYQTPEGLCLLLKPTSSQLRIEALGEDCATPSNVALTVSGTRPADLNWVGLN